MTIVESEAAVSVVDMELVRLAAECVVAAQFASTAMVQRKLRTSWAESSAVLAELETGGVVGAPGGDHQRPVLIEATGLAAALAVIENHRQRPADPVVLPAVPEPAPAQRRPARPVELVKHQPTTVEHIHDAELVPDQPGDEHRQHVIGRLRNAPAAVQARRQVVRLVTSKPAASGGQLVRQGAKAAWVIGQGGVSWARRAQSGATHGNLREQIRLARLTGDHSRVTDLTKQLDDARTSRQKRLVALPSETLAVLATVGLVVLAVLAAVFLGAVVAWAMPGGVDWSSWWAGFNAAVSLAADVVKLVFWLATWLAVPLAVLAVWREGKRAADFPSWLLTPLERKLADSEITPSKVVVALRDLGITELRKALKEAPDAGAGLLGPIAVAGCGVEVDVLLPSGVSTDQILAHRQRQRFAENLGRHQFEVFLTVPAARTVRAWIANPGALDEPVGPSPLVIDPSIKADFYTGQAPWGHNLRGEPITISLLQRHLSLAGISNQGKTATGRALALWLAKDVTVEFQIADLKGIGDWHMFRGLATYLIEGPTDDHVIAATEMLEGGVKEMERRQAALDKDRYPNGVTRELARKPGGGFHPIVYIIDEQQVAIMCPAVGADKRPYGGTKKNSRYFNALRALLNQGRAYNLVVWQFTQNPTDTNFPVLLREGAHIRAALPVGTESQSKMALGESPVDKGAAPHELRAGIDKGVVVVAGDGAPLPDGQFSVQIRTHFIDGVQATEIVRACIESRRKAGRIAREVETGMQLVDHLADIHAAMRDERRVRTVVVLGRLIEDNAAVYEPWSHSDLAKAVAEYEHLGLDIRKYGGDSVLRLEEVQAALDRRE